MAQTTGAGKGDAAVLENHGQIAMIKFPPGWVLGEPAENPGIGARSFREAVKEGSPDTSVAFFYRGLPVNEKAADSFKAVLASPAHDLGELEIESLRGILALKTPVGSDQFKLTGARTEDRSGKRVLVVEGEYPGSGDRIHELYVDADGSGRFVQEIFYQAPQLSYDRHLDEAQSALKSIVWK